MLWFVMGYGKRPPANKTQSGDGGGVWCNVSRYGLPGSGLIMRDTGGKLEAIDGESIRISDY